MFICIHFLPSLIPSRLNSIELTPNPVKVINHYRKTTTSSWLVGMEYIQLHIDYVDCNCTFLSFSFAI